MLICNRQNDFQKQVLMNNFDVIQYDLFGFFYIYLHVYVDNFYHKVIVM